MLKGREKSRLLDNKKASLATSTHVLDRKHWPRDIYSQLTFGGKTVK
jgi:hypothetical protein